MVMEAQLFDGTILEFPDGTDPAVIQQAAKKMTVGLRESGVQAPEPQQQTTSNPILGFGARASDILGNVLEAGTRLTEKPLAQLPEQYRPDLGVVNEMSQYAKDISKRINYSPTTKLGDLGENPLNVVPFIAERVITSSPDMMAAYAAAPVYIMARTNEILNTRLQNDKKEFKDTTIGDLSASIGAAVLETYLEKFATKGLLTGKGPLGGSVAKRIGKETAIQTGTESAEEGIGYLGGAAGTTKGVDPVEMAQNMIEGAIVGGGLGAGVQGGKEYFNRPSAVTPQVPPAAAPIPSNVAPTPPSGAVPTFNAPTSAQDYDAMMAELEGRPVTQAAQMPPEVTPVAPATPETFAPQAPEVNQRALEQNNFVFPEKGGIKSVYGDIVEQDGKKYIQYRNEAGDKRQRLLTENVMVNPSPDQLDLMNLYKERDKLANTRDEFLRFLKQYKIKPSEKSDMGIDPSDKRIPVGVFNKEKGLGLDDLALIAVEEGILTEQDLQEGVGGVDSMRNLIRQTLTGEQPTTLVNADRDFALKRIQDEIDAREANAVAPEEAVAGQLDQEAADVVEATTLPMGYSNSTVEQKELHEKAADLYRQEGRDSNVIYQDGDLGLIQTRQKNGDVIYMPVKGSKYSTQFVDIETPQGKQLMDALRIAPEQQQALLNVKKDIETKAAETHAKTPFLVMKPGVTGSPATPKDMVNVARGWAKMLGLKGDIHMMTKQEAEANADKFTGPHRAIGYMGKKTQFGMVRELQDGSYAVIINPGVSKIRTMETIAHELGHIHEWQVFNKADVPTKNAIIKEFNTWFNTHHKISAKELVESMRPKVTAQQTAFADPMAKASTADPYWRNFTEWYADQVSRWSTSTEKPLTVVDKFFKKLADALKNFYKTVKGQKFLPTQTMKEFLDGIASRVQIDEIADSKNKGQMALFSQQTMETADKTQTPEFKRWFGNSKIVNEDGSPRAVYHGTKQDFSEFKTSYADGLFFFSTNPKFAGKWPVGTGGLRESSEENKQEYQKIKDLEQSLRTKYMSKEYDFASDSGIAEYDADRQKVKDELKNKTGYSTATEFEDNAGIRVMPVYLSIQKPFDPRTDYKKIESFLRAKGMQNLIDGDYHKSGNWVVYENKDVIQELKKLGYDGIWLAENVGGPHETIAAFSNKQIKSATGNTGAYDPDSTNISESQQTMAAPGRRNYAGSPAPLASWDMPDATKLDDWIYRLQDKHVDTKRMIAAINQKVGQIEDKWDSYLKEELYHGRTAKRTNDFLKDDLLPIVKQMQKDNISVEQFDDYLHNRHAEERNIQVAKINPDMPDAGSGIKTAEANAYLDGLDPKRRSDLESLAKKVDSIIKDTQNILVQSGLEEQSTIDAWNSTYKNYVPLMREDLDFANKGTGLGSGFATKGGSTKRAVGSLKNVSDIFANIASQRERAIVRSEKARVGTSLYGLAITNPNPGFWLPVNPDAIKDTAQMKKELVAMGLDEADAENLMQEPKQQYIDPITGLVAYRVNPILRNSDNVFPVRINGKDRFIFFNPNDERSMRMATAIKNLDAEQLGWALGNAAKVTRWIASVNTQYNPVFGAYNFIRDVGGAQFNLSTTPIAGEQKAVIAGVFPALKGIYKDLRASRDGKPIDGSEWSKLFEEYQREGGATGYRDQFSRNRDESSVIEREMANLNKGNVKKAVNSVFNWLSDYNDAMENAVRLSAYKVALDKGLTKERAASLAKNLTVNFNRKGERAQQLGSLYAFFNASVQGTARLAETLKGPAGKKIIAGGIFLGSVQALALAMAGFEDDDIPEFVKERNLVIPLPGKKYAAIPMPLGLHVIPNMGRIPTEMVLSGGKNSAKKVGNLLGVFLNSFNPIGNAGMSFQTLAPTLTDPMVAIFENKDSFGRPIAKEDRATNPTPGYTRSRDTASELSKGLSYFLNYVSSGGSKYQKGWLSPTPDQLDFLFGQATGGVGREVMKAEQAVTSLVTGEELPSYKVPLVGKFYGDTGSQAAQSSRFYENVTEMANHENEIKGRLKNRESVTDYYKDHPEARLYSQANTIENEITKLNKEKKELIAKNAPKKQIKTIEDKKTAIMQRFNERVSKLEK